MNAKSIKTLTTVGKGSGRTRRYGGTATTSVKAARPAPPTVVKALRALTGEVDALKNRLMQMEARQTASYVPQSPEELPAPLPPPVGMTPMQAIMGRLDVEETTEELLAQLKALD